MFQVPNRLPKSNGADCVQGEEMSLLFEVNGGTPCLLTSVSKRLMKQAICLSMASSIPIRIYFPEYFLSNSWLDEQDVNNLIKESLFLLLEASAGETCDVSLHLGLNLCCLHQVRNGRTYTLEKCCR